MGFAARAHKKRLRLLNRVYHQKQGEAAEITLEKLDEATGAPLDLLVIRRDWAKRREMRSLEFVEFFQIARAALTFDERQDVHSVRHSDRRYKIAKPKAEPQGLEQYWELVIAGIEPIE